MDNKPCQSPKCTVCGIPHECDYEFLQRELKEAKKVLRFYANEMNYKGTLLMENT